MGIGPLGSDAQTDELEGQGKRRGGVSNLLMLKHHTVYRVQGQKHRSYISHPPPQFKEVSDSVSNCFPTALECSQPHAGHSSLAQAEI